MVLLRLKETQPPTILMVLFAFYYNQMKNAQEVIQNTLRQVASFLANELMH